MHVPTRSSLVSFASKTVTGAIAGTMLVMASANAAGLGKLTVLSSLGQPLRAEIELTAVSPEEASTLVAKLAPADSFRLANIELNPALLALRFEVEQRNGRSVLKVMSAQPLNEPFIDMLLELNWNGGRMVREYTFLLDTSEQRAAQAPQVAAPSGTERNGAASPTQPTQPTQPSQAVSSEVTVKPGDNLTRIANQVKPVDVSLDVMLVALYRANPEAFSGKNMNRLKSGQILAVPDADSIRSGTAEAEARTVVVAHAADFNAYRAKLAGQVANSTPARERESSANASGKISAKVEQKPSAVNAAQDKLTLSKAGTEAPPAAKSGMALEDKIARQKELDEAVARTRELEKNVQDLQKLMTVESAAGADRAKSAASPASAAASAEASAPVQRSMVLPPKKLQPSLLEKLTEHLEYVGLGLAALLAAAAGLIAARRRKQSDVESPPTAPSILGDALLPAASAQTAAEVPEASVAAPVHLLDTDPPPAPVLNTLDSNEVDPVAEADVYIAYGRDAQAEEILKEALRSHPERHAVRLKLLEIYVNRKDARAFESQASELYALTRGQGDEWAQAAAVGQALDPGNPLYTEGAPEAGMAVGSDVEPAVPAFDVAAPTLDNDMETALPQAADASVSPASVAAQVDNLMDFDLGGLSFESTPPALETSAIPEPGYQLDFDTAETAPVEQRADDFSADVSPALSLDLPTEPEAPAAARLPSASSDPLDLDLMSFSMPEASAPVADQTDAGAAPEVAADAVPATAAAEFDLSGIDLDLDGVLAPANNTSAPAAAPERDETLSAHHMEMDTKLDLAIAYQEIGDKEGARELLDEVLRGGSDEQISRANAMKAEL